MPRHFNGERTGFSTNGAETTNIHVQNNEIGTPTSQQNKKYTQNGSHT